MNFSPLEGTRSRYDKINPPIVSYSPSSSDKNSTSSNISGRDTPSNFMEIEEEIKNSVDYIVEYRQTDTKKNIPSAIIKINKDGTKEIIRV